MKIDKIEIIYDGKYLDNYRSYSKLTITINSIKYHYEKFLRFVHENVEGTLECNVESDNYQMLFEKLCSLFENYNPDEEIHMTCINPTDINIYYEDGTVKEMYFYLNMHRFGMDEIAETIKVMMEEYLSLPSYLYDQDIEENE